MSVISVSATLTLQAKFEFIRDMLIARQRAGQPMNEYDVEAITKIWDKIEEEIRKEN